MMDKVFEQFANLLGERFSKNTYTTEDSIRYTLFYALTQFADIYPSDIILEHPYTYDNKKNAEIDAYLPSKGLVFECKFDKAMPSGKNSPRTQKAGQVFDDIFRLLSFKSEDDIHRFLVYVTDDEMATYFQNPSNRINDFFNLNPGETLMIGRDYINNHKPTFVNQISKEAVGSCSVTCKLSRNLPTGFWVRIYEVKRY